MISVVIAFAFLAICNGAPPTLKNCDQNAAGKAVELILHGGQAGDENFTPLSKLLVKFKMTRTFSANAKVTVRLSLQKKLGLLGFIGIPNMVYGFLAREVSLPKGIAYIKENEFLVTCDALTTNNIAMCPPQIGKGTAFVDLHPIYEVLKKYLNTPIGKYIADGEYKLHAEAMVIADGNFAPYPLACVDVTATSILH